MCNVSTSSLCLTPYVLYFCKSRRLWFILFIWIREAQSTTQKHNLLKFPSSWSRLGFWFWFHFSFGFGFETWIVSVRDGCVIGELTFRIRDFQFDSGQYERESVWWAMWVSQEERSSNRNSWKIHPVCLQSQIFQLGFFRLFHFELRDCVDFGE